MRRYLPWIAIALLALGHWQQMREAERVRQQMRVYEIVLINRGKEIDRVSTVTARQIDELRAAQEPVALSPLRLPDVQAGKEVFR